MTWSNPSSTGTWRSKMSTSTFSFCWSGLTSTISPSKSDSGPLADFDGEITDVNPDAQKLQVMVNIFERQVPVEVGFDNVKKLD